MCVLVRSFGATVVAPGGIERKPFYRSLLHGLREFYKEGH
jgi:hypothetical protein